MQDLLKQLLDINPKRRLGAKGAEQIKKHSFFNGFDWNDLQNKQLKAPFVPLSSASYFTYKETKTDKTIIRLKT
uniref:AGC-kinase C-terminal domain-containing protein n=1 Tax=Ditylenchus dipsaci TaxID=166011 RepID=A0A915DDX2_9BILA